jgi:hypothetical protein
MTPKMHVVVQSGDWRRRSCHFGRLAPSPRAGGSYRPRAWGKRP